MYMCCNLPSTKKPTLEKFNPPLLHIVPSTAFPIISPHTWEKHYSVHFLKKNKDINY